MKQVVCSYAELNAIMRAAFPLIVDFACTTFPELCELQPAEKTQLFKHFVISLFYLESYHRSAILYELDDSRRALTHLTCMDLQNLKPLYGHMPVDKLNGIDPKDIIVNRCMRPRLMEMLKAFKRIALSEVEIAAMVALVLTSHDCSLLDDRISIICQPIRDKINAELNKHYASSSDPGRNALRLGDLLSFLAEFQDFAATQKRDHSVISMFAEDKQPGFLLSLAE
ncbi:hypothetical protein PFISCL1PPCAC_3403, partial [Pristionchus fissidentatus]